MKPFMFYVSRIFVMTITVVLTLVTINWFKFHAQQHRQIDQLCNIIHYQLNSNNEMDILEYDSPLAGEYSLFLADYEKNAAIMLYAPQRDNKKMQHVLIVGIPPKILKNWGWGEVRTSCPWRVQK